VQLHQLLAPFLLTLPCSSVEKSLTGELNLSLKNLEQKLKAASTSAMQLAAYHELAHFWSEEFRFFELVCLE